VGLELVLTLEGKPIFSAMEVVHVSAECYPVAKAGGLGDVVGALPKYQNKAGITAKVVMPMYRTSFLYTSNWVVDYKAKAFMGAWEFEYTIIKEATGKLGFDLYLVDIHGLLDRQKIYGYPDDVERFTAFQIAVVHWMSHWNHRPSVVHCHDYHAGLIPFMIQHCYDYQNLKEVPTVLTIHNAQYQGWMGWHQSELIPRWDLSKKGLLDWGNCINPLAAAIKCASKITTVSPSYMRELMQHANGLEYLFASEKNKCVGILNGIDHDVWNPATDTNIEAVYTVNTVMEGKQKNKEIICSQYGLDASLPLFVFIGRLVGEKAADVLPAAIDKAIQTYGAKASYMILGSGDPAVEMALSKVAARYNNIFKVYIGYNEVLSHGLYASADFLLMPSRVEPCGLNQLYAMRYGTVPMVRSTGGLQDTVVDMGDKEGYGIRFTHANEKDIVDSIGRAIDVYDNNTHLLWMRQFMMQINHSWDQTVESYTRVYKSI
jgi:starch synthase